MRATTYREYQDRKTARAKIASANRSRRWQNPPQPTLPLPELLNPPLVRVAYSEDGYEGVLLYEHDPNPAHKIKIEPARREFPLSTYVDEQGKFLNP